MVQKPNNLILDMETGGVLMKLRVLLIIVFTTVCIGATSIVALVADNSIQKQTSAKIEAQLSSKTFKLASDINGWMMGKAQVAEGISALMGEGIGEDITPEYLNQVLLTKSNKGILSDLYVGTVDGIMIDGSLWVPDKGYDPRQRPWYQAAEKGDSVVFTDTYVDMVTDKLVISIANPIISKTGTLQGVLAIDLLLDTITQIVSAEKIGETGYAFMLDASGIVLAHPDAAMLNTNISDIKDLKEVAQKMLSNESGFEKYTLHNDKKILVYKKLPSTNWVIAVTIDQSEVYAELVKSRITFIVIIALVYLFVFGITFVAANQITKPIKKLTAAATLASEGDLRIQINHNGTREIRELSSAFNIMSNNIRKLVTEIRDAANLINHSTEDMSHMTLTTKSISDEIARTAGELANGAQDQAESVSVEAEMINDMSEAMKQIASASKDSNEMILDVSNSVQSGVRVLENQTMLMKKNKESTAKVGIAIAELEEKSHVIQQIVEVISSIAKQTNLLALNAAIEAARAGENGKGFAVVADHVRKLAEQSAKSSGEIERLLHEIQAKTLQSVTEVVDVQKVVSDQEASLEETRKLYQEIETAVKMIVDRTESINDETKRIEIQSEKVSASISNVAAVTEESAAATEEVASATTEQSSAVLKINNEVGNLVKEANALLNIVSHFKI